MKRGSEYARRVKRLFQQLVRKFGKPAANDPTDPLEQMLASILAACTTSHKAWAVFRRLRQQMVDLNELRVTPPMELADQIGAGIPRARDKAQRIVDLLNDVRRRQDALDLSFLRQRGRREAREYLESLQGADRSAAASVVLFSLGGHAIPVDDLTLYVLRKEGMVDESANAGEVQGFLERHVSAADARAFAELLGKYVARRGARVPVAQLDALLKPAPPGEAGGDGQDAPGAVPPESESGAQKRAASKKLAAAGAKTSTRPPGSAAKDRKNSPEKRPEDKAQRKTRRRSHK